MMVSIAFVIFGLAIARRRSHAAEGATGPDRARHVHCVTETYLEGTPALKQVPATSCRPARDRPDGTFHLFCLHLIFQAVKHSIHLVEPLST